MVNECNKLPSLLEMCLLEPDFQDKPEDQQPELSPQHQSTDRILWRLIVNVI
jgi:hypothetical protein